MAVSTLLLKKDRQPGGNKMSLYSIVVPVYNSEHTLEELYNRLRNVFEQIMQEDFELILVDDSSRDNSYAVMENFIRRIPVLKLFKWPKFWAASRSTLWLFLC